MRRRTTQKDKLDAALDGSDSLTELLFRLLLSHENLKSSVFCDLIRSGPSGQRLVRKLHSLLREPQDFDAEKERVIVTFFRCAKSSSRDS